MRSLFPLTLAATLVLTTPLFAETREERLALAQDYAQSSVEDMDMGRMIKQMYMPVLNQIATQSGKTATEDQLAQIDALYMKTFEEPFRDLMLGQAEIMADMLTYEEIKALSDFYSSPEGRSVMQKLPDIMGAQQPAIIQMVQSRMGAIIPQIKFILKLQ